MLLILVAERHRVVDKDELMRRGWTDSLVAEDAGIASSPTYEMSPTWMKNGSHQAPSDGAFRDGRRGR
jgi:hypothetical protein